MWYKTFLPQVHSLINPHHYIEIGIRHGYSLSISPHAQKIAIDPAYGRADMQHDVANTTFFRCTSDSFFENNLQADILPHSYDLGYIDGMHLFEYALRDLINLEKW